MRRMFFGVAALGILALSLGFLPQDQQQRPRGQFQFNPQQDSARMARRDAQVEGKLAELKKSIEGQEDKPATEVFKNIQLLKVLKAGQVPELMGTWSRSLGTACEHCHTVDQWAKEDKPEKQVARDMSVMMYEINSKLISNIKNLDSKNPQISCWTCHAGRVKPSRPPWERNNFRREG